MQLNFDFAYGDFVISLYYLLNCGTRTKVEGVIGLLALVARIKDVILPFGINFIVLLHKL